MQTGIIGKRIRVIRSSNKYLEKIHGTVVDETKKTVIIDMHGNEKIIEKKACVFEIEGKIVEGKDLLGNPWERIKKSRKVVARW